MSILLNGKVLITGGENSDVFFNSAELYNPSRGNWTITGNMNAIRTKHTQSVLTNGPVLVAGGRNEGLLASTELY
ncbi:unnamed protein product [Adineta steineri]|uniref:Uncharacterized protein n=1 Tax=Adineta steineri TaxID=433720 RepID=A0A814V9R2_9BILA|nr:unnamed protein product [Adineta steineri]CAF1300230.1 unnamed protein product [Adineta steineri]CAF1303042.1 unnamed protein product [Adineta steineri]CAF3587628.1 unnamed protein product [Adineta steineri]CAF3787334.1 unnamed protein product [Adineta steineri]